MPNNFFHKLAQALTTDQPRPAIHRAELVKGLGYVFVVPVFGTLIQRGRQSGCTSYGDIHTAVELAMNLREVVGVLLEIDSDVGAPAGLLDLADFIRNHRDRKPIHAFVNERALGPACVLASAAAQVGLPRTGMIGKVGAMTKHIDQSASNRRLGFVVTTIFGGARKNDFSPHQPLSKAARAEAEARVKSVYGLTVETLARNRGIDPAILYRQESAFFSGAAAITAGLADTVETRDQALARLLNAARSSRGKSRPAPTSQASTPTEQSQATSPRTPAPFNHETFTEQIRNQARQIYDLCALAGHPELMGEIIQDCGFDVERARAAILAHKAAQADNTLVGSSTTAGPGTDGDLLLRDARRRAAVQEESNTPPPADNPAGQPHTHPNQ